MEKERDKPHFPAWKSGRGLEVAPKNEKGSPFLFGLETIR